MYTVDYFINKFEAIPEDRWVENQLEQIIIPARKFLKITIKKAKLAHCANGHCGVTRENNSVLFPLDKTQESIGLYKVFGVLNLTDRWNDTIEDNEEYSNKAAMINNGATREYQQSTPKQRILAALRDVKKLEEAKLYTKDATKELLAIAQSPDMADTNNIITAKQPEIVYG